MKEGLLNRREPIRFWRVRRLLRELTSGHTLSPEECVELFSLATLGEWYGPQKKEVRKSWAVAFSDGYFVATDEKQREIVTQIACLPPVRQVSFLEELFEFGPPKGQGGDGRWRGELVGALYRKLQTDTDRNQFKNYLRVSPHIPGTIKEQLGINPPSDSMIMLQREISVTMPPGD